MDFNIDQNKNIQKLMTYPGLVLLWTSFWLFLFLFPQSPLYEVKHNFYFLFFSIVTFLIGLSIKKVFLFFMRGKFVLLVADSVGIIFNGAGVFLFFFLASDNTNLKVASGGVFFLVAGLILNKLSKIFKYGIFRESILKASSYVFFGVFVKYTLHALSPNGKWDVGVKISIGDLFLYTFILLGIMQLLSLVDIIENINLRKISIWLKKKHGLKFAGLWVFNFVLIDLRRDIVKWTIIENWIMVFVVLMIAIIIICLKFWGAVRHNPEERFMKHFQHFGYDKIKDITSMSRYIDDFIENGVKNNLVSCLFFIAYKSGLTLGVANGVIAPLVEYKDMDILPLATKGVYNVVKERNRQNRIAVIEDLTRNFEFYGRRVGYNNEYGAASSQM